ncbi:MAG: gamma-glutamylcyclotransferase family protein [Verrucomicrobiales bacterium]
MNVFTYGSLIFADVWMRVAGQSCPSRLATLDDFAAWKVRGESYPGLAPAPGQSTSGLLYLNVSADAAARLDAFEGPFYHRTSVTVRLADGTTLDAETYVVAPAHRHELEPVAWDAEEFRQHHLASFLGPKQPANSDVNPGKE